MSEPERSSSPELPSRIGARIGAIGNAAVYLQSPGALEEVARIHGYDLTDPIQANNAQAIFNLLGTDSVLRKHYWRTMMLEDENQRLRVENEALRRELRTNPKSGLPNAVAFWEDFPRLVEEANTNGQGVALLFCDVNGFKFVNDKRGYDAGDLLIKRTMSSIRGAVRNTAHVYHISGDECVILILGLPNVDDNVAAIAQPSGRHAVEPFPELRGEEAYTNPQRIAVIKNRIRQRLRTEVFVGQFEGFDLELAIGAAISAGSRKLSTRELFVGANDAMHEDKKDIKQHFRRRKATGWKIIRAIGDLCDKLTIGLDTRKA